MTLDLRRPTGPEGAVWPIVIIGAGQAGLSAAASLVRHGLRPGRDFLVLDSNAGPGGAWRHRWDSLTLGRAHRVADLPGFPLGEVNPDLPARVVVSDYYGRFEEALALQVVRPARVVAVRSTEPVRRGQPTSSPLELTVTDGTTRVTTRARFVISATGTWTQPYIPAIPGAAAFQGRQLHTVDFTNVPDFAGQRVVVVGGGLSAVQFLLELAPVASTVWATRRPPNFTAAPFNTVWGAQVEAAVDARTAAGLPPASVVRTTGIPSIPQYLQAVRDGILVSRGMFDRIGPHAVRFSPAATTVQPGGLGPSAGDGTLVQPASWQPFPEPTWVEADVIFWNTGFRPALRHLAPLHLRRPGESGIRMSSKVEVADDPRILLVGYGSSASTLGATRAGRQAARVALRRLGVLPPLRRAPQTRENAAGPTDDSAIRP